MEIEETLKKYEGLVISIANKYVGNGLSFEELKQCGDIGLFEAITKFDKSKGYELSTYATYYIRNEIENGIDELSGISKYKNQQVRKMKKIVNELTQELKREPTDREIADKLEIPLEKLVELKSLSQQNISLENTIDGESASVVADFIADNSMTPEEQLIHEEEKRDSQLIKETFLKTLYYYERVVYTLRYEKKMNITSIAKKLNTNRVRINDIQKDIEKKYNDFFESEEYYKITNGKTDNLLKKIIEERKQNIDVSANGGKFAEYENYEKLSEIDFKEISKRFKDEYAINLKFPTFWEYFKEICETKDITYAKFKRATGLSKSQFETYKTPKAKPSISAIVSFGIYFKLGINTVNALLETGGYKFKKNDRTHLAYSFVLEQLKGYPIEYCNKVLELLGVEEAYLLNSNRKKRGKNKKKQKI